jgi:hypothetical protein
MNNNTYFNDVIPYLVDYYNQFETLPTKVLECTKGTGSYTCFGQNLKTKVEKAGSIEKLLRSFIGRGAKTKTEKAEKITKAVTAKIEKRIGKKLPTNVEIITPTTATV